MLLLQAVRLGANDLSESLGPGPFHLARPRAEEYVETTFGDDREVLHLIGGRVSTPPWRWSESELQVWDHRVADLSLDDETWWLGLYDLGERG
jgi:hypothetical protein